MKLFRCAVLAGGILVLALAFGYTFHVQAIIALWPWPDGKLSYLFVGSILAAVSASMLWIGWIDEPAALPGGALNIFVISATSTVYLFKLYLQGDHPGLLIYPVATLLMAAASIAVFLWSRRSTLRDSRPAPRPVRISFAIFLAVLVAASASLFFKLPIFPWALNPDSSVIFGCIFLGNATYFLYGLLHPRWHNALGQLASFLAYDLVLIGPFLLLFETIKPEFLFNLAVYVLVLLYSGGLAVYYLFIDKETRNWAVISR